MPALHLSHTWLPAGRNERIRDVRMGPDGHRYLLTDRPAGKILRVEG